MLRALCLDGSGVGKAKTVTIQMLDDLQIETRRVMPLKAWGGRSWRRTGNSEVIEVRSTKQTVGRLNSCTRIASFDRVYSEPLRALTVDKWFLNKCGAVDAQYRRDDSQGLNSFYKSTLRLLCNL